jgi:molybdenum cofactor guanylyltransferase
MSTATEPLQVSGVVLAGGRSSRMGRDKAMLLWLGRPLIENQIALLHAAGADTVHVSGHRPEYHGVSDPISDRGPLGGIAGIAAAMGDGVLLIVPIDMPRLQPSLLQRLRTEATQANCVHFADHVLPMRLRLNASCREALAELMALSDDRLRSLRALQERVGIIEIALNSDEAAQLIDCNTEETWREVCE